MEMNNGKGRSWLTRCSKEEEENVKPGGSNVCVELVTYEEMAMEC